ncbi:MAG: type II secretion system protein [Thermodesulfobacteriota bacterium]
MKSGCRPNGKNGAAGFTLLEVLVAVTILGMAYLAILQNFSTSLRNISRVERSSERFLVAQLEMDRHFLADNIDDDELEGEVYVEGLKYKILLVSPENDEKLATMIFREQ